MNLHCSSLRKHFTRSLWTLLAVCALVLPPVESSAADNPSSAIPVRKVEQPVRGAIVFPEHVPVGYKLVYDQRFAEPDALKTFRFTDPAAWRLAKSNDFAALELVRQSKYTPVVRSPVNIALIADKIVGDFVLEVDLIQTGREYGHRDMCLFFGFQSPTNFYYAHIATAADPNAHNIFIVNNAPRTNIAKETTKGVNWGLGVWHKVRLERNVTAGTIKVFFDDLTKPIMTAEDKRLGAGQIGFGSFDDTGMIDNIRLWSPRVETRATGFLKPPTP